MNPPAPTAAVCGLWHLGSTAAAGLLTDGFRVVAHDPLPELRASAPAGIAPTGEPGVGPALLAGAAEGRLRIADTLAEWAGHGLCLLAYDSAVDAAGGVDDPRLPAAVTAFARYAPAGAVLVVLSQVPARTHTGWRRTLLAGRPDTALVHVPENLSLGTALENFRSPPRLVVGAEDRAAAERAAALFPRATPEFTGLTEAELVKHATNAYLGMCVSFANELGWIAARLGADPRVVMRLLKADRRVSDRAPLMPGTAFSGATLRRDLVALGRLGEEYGRPELFDTVLTLNDRHAGFPLELLRAELGPLRTRRIAVAGLTYKPGTATLRDSLPLRLVRTLVAEGAAVSVYDPVAEPLPADAAVRREATLDAAVRGADALVAATALPELRDTRWAELDPVNPLVVDGCGVLDPETLSAAGWRCLGLHPDRPEHPAGSPAR
ncbi:UDP binding domain-containing protein [Streptomyces sp. CAU 1734]|uniref:UDP binding domain-containing protein n=1 Tax=Streptomyces sp. CAU 1734 TaxID=3140360 RepID=UPI00326100D9